MEKKLDCLLREFKEFKTEVKELSKGLDFLNAGVEDLKKELCEILENQKRINKENKKLRVELNVLNKQVGEMKLSVELLENEKLSDSLEISCVPQADNEVVMETVMSIAKVVGFPCEKKSIKEVFRRKAKMNGRPGDIVVKLVNPDDRDKFVNAIKKKKLNAHDLGLGGNKAGVYAKELLTPYGKDLFYKALTFRKAEDWKYIWTKRGLIFLKEKDGARFHIIKSISDIQNLRN